MYSIQFNTFHSNVFNYYELLCVIHIAWRKKWQPTSVFLLG